MGGQGELRGWVEDDFVDEVSSQPLVENDPWDPNVPPSAPGLSLPGRLGSESEANTAHQADLDSASDFVDELADIDPGDQWSDGAFDPATAWAEPDPTIDASAAGDDSRRSGVDEAHARDGDAGPVQAQLEQHAVRRGRTDYSEGGAPGRGHSEMRAVIRTCFSEGFRFYM